MFQIIIICFCVLICFLLLVNLYIVQKRFNKLHSYLQDIHKQEFKYKNLYYMVEYNLRNYKETHNTKAFINNLDNLIYKTGVKNGKE